MSDLPLEATYRQYPWLLLGGRLSNQKSVILQGLRGFSWFVWIYFWGRRRARSGGRAARDEKWNSSSLSYSLPLYERCPRLERESARRSNTPQKASWGRCSSIARPLHSAWLSFYMRKKILQHASALSRIDESIITDPYQFIQNGGLLFLCSKIFLVIDDAIKFICDWFDNKFKLVEFKVDESFFYRFIPN